MVSAGSAGVAVGKVVYVDGRASGADNGTSWADAYMFLQDALADAGESDKPVEIRVAQGLYKPDASAAEPNGTGRVEAAFALANDVALRGGYAGFGEPDPNARDIDLHETILGGDLNGDDVEMEHPWQMTHDVTRFDNSGHVVVATDTDSSACLDGFTVTAGYYWAICELHTCGGGGLYNRRASPTIIGCTFVANAGTGGGAILNVEGSNPRIVNCIFTGNQAISGGAVYGGEPAIEGCSFLGNYGGVGGGLIFCNGPIVECKFTANYAYYYGGAILSCRGPISDCVFSYNVAGEGGGAIHTDTGYGDTLTLRNCILSCNSARWGRGGALYIRYDATITIANCTFSGNSAKNGNAFACYRLHDEDPPSRLYIADSILFDDGDEIWTNHDSTIVVTHSNVEGGYPGEGNIDADPCFAAIGYWDDNYTYNDPWDDTWVDGDYHLKSQAGRWDANEGGWVTDEATSPCIDAGDPMTPIGPEPFPNGGRINMGAYGGTPEASKSYFGTAPCETIVAGDVNGDCNVNFLDFRIMALHWLESP